MGMVPVSDVVSVTAGELADKAEHRQSLGSLVVWDLGARTRTLPEH